MKTVVLSLALFLVCALSFTPRVFGHCQIPCGIYDDHARVKSMLEDVQTIEKSTKLINELAGKTDAQSKNQLVRWVMNKEKHAQNIISTISDYFLTQRVKPAQKDYITRLIKHHAVIIAAMKAKQNANQKEVEKLRKTVKALLNYYPKPDAHKNQDHHHAAH